MSKKIIGVLVVALLLIVGHLFFPYIYTAPSVNSSVAATGIPDAQFYKNLIETYNNNTTRVLDIAKWVILIVGAFSGGGGVYFYVSSSNKINEVNHVIESLTQELKKLSSQSGDLKDHIKITRDEIRNFEDRLKELSNLTENAQKNIRTMREDTFRQQVLLNLKSPNSALRLASVQKLGNAECEDMIISVLVDRLQHDSVNDICIEASASIGQVLCSDAVKGQTEHPAFQYGISALFENLNTKNSELDEEILRSLMNIFKLGYQFSRVQLNKIRKAHQGLAESQLKKDLSLIFLNAKI